MATPKKPGGKKPLKVQLLNASGKIIESMILSGKWPEENPAIKKRKSYSCAKKCIILAFIFFTNLRCSAKEKNIESSHINKTIKFI